MSRLKYPAFETPIPICPSQFSEEIQRKLRSFKHSSLEKPMDPQDLENINALLDRDVELREVTPINRPFNRS